MQVMITRPASYTVLQESNAVLAVSIRHRIPLPVIYLRHAHWMSPKMTHLVKRMTFCWNDVGHSGKLFVLCLWDAGHM